MSQAKLIQFVSRVLLCVAVLIGANFFEHDGGMEMGRFGFVDLE